MYEVLATETGPAPSPWAWRRYGPSGDELGRGILEHVVTHLRKHPDTFDMFNETATRLIGDEAIRAKHHLSTHQEAHIDLKGLSAGLEYEDTLTRDKFEEINRDLFRSTLRSVEKALKEAKLSRLDIDDIILVGGASRTPFIQQMLRDYFVLSPLSGVEPDEAVVRGAARQAEYLSDDYDDGYCTLTLDFLDDLYDENGRFIHASKLD
jgi:molecular chaperone DnaK (HSP70)